MAQPQSTLPQFLLVNGTVKERLAQTMLLSWFRRYQLDKWLYAETVQIEEGTIPHSHPVLTLSPTTPWIDYLADPEQLLAAYLHEQLHWFLVLEEKFAGGKQAMVEFRARYPDLPVKLPEGCGSDFSNYLHIIVNYLEYSALAELLGQTTAQSIIGRVPHYTEIYALVLRKYEQIGDQHRRGARSGRAMRLAGALAATRGRRAPAPAPRAAAFHRPGQAR